MTERDLELQVTDLHRKMDQQRVELERVIKSLHEEIADLRKENLKMLTKLIHAKMAEPFNRGW